MPLIALAVGAYALGLIFGFAALHAVAITCAIVVVALSRVLRRGALVPIALLIVAGDAVATDRRWRDKDCVTRLSQADSVRIELLVDANERSMAFGRTSEPGCDIRASVEVRQGKAPYGAIVVASGKMFANGPGVLVKNGTIDVVRGPGVLAKLRSRASRALQRDFGDDAPLAKALLIAEMADLGPEVRDRFAAAGLVHILSISGLHVTIVATAVLLVLEAMRLPKKYALIAGCVLTAFYVGLIGAPPPAVRSAVMFGALATSKLLQRPTSSWASLALGAAWPLPGNPRVALDIGWQLTVAGMIALITAGNINKRWIDGRLTGIKHKLATEISTGIVATIVTAPLVAWYFGRTSLVAPLANIAANPVANLLQPTLFLALALGWWPSAAGLVADAARPGLHALDAVASGAAAVPGANVGVTPTLGGALLFAVAIFAVVTAMRGMRPMRSVTVCAAAFAGIVWLPIAPHGSGELEMHAIDVGQGDAIALRTPKGRWILVDAGRTWTGGDAGRRAVIPYVRRLGGDVALFVLTHPHADHVGGAPSVLDALTPGAYWDAAFVGTTSSYRASLDVAARQGIPWRRVHPGDVFRADGVAVRVLAPDSAWTVAQDDPNLASTVLMVEYGRTRFLLTGDAEAEEEEWLRERWGDTALRADVLKSGHHGSRTSSSEAFLAAVQPSIAVISVGAGNVYHHPDRPVIDRYLDRGMAILRTDELGSVVVSSNGSRLKFAGADGVWVERSR